MREPILRVRNVCAVYPTVEGMRTVLSDISLYVNAGELVGIIGESGSGKTTLTDVVLQTLHFKGGKVTEGSVYVDGEPLAQRHIGTCGYVPQNPDTALDPLFRVESNFHEILRARYPRMSKRERNDYITSVMRQVHLAADDAHLKSYPHQLSGGMKQRILIALALSGNPKMIITDEPTSNLDALTQYAIVSLFKELCRSHSVACMMTTHNLRLARAFCDRVYVFYEGKVVESGKTEHVFDDPQHEYTKRLLDAVASEDR